MGRRGRRRRRGKLEALSQVLSAHVASDFAAALPLPLITWWRQQWPRALADLSEPVAWRAGVLQVRVAHAAVAAELEYQRCALEESLRQAGPQFARCRLRFVVAPLVVARRSSRRSALAPSLASRPPLQPVQLPEPVARALAGIADDAVRQAVSAAACQSLAG
ncbi:MAG: DciA family protein [Polyangiales bacterium]